MSSAMDAAGYVAQLLRVIELPTALAKAEALAGLTAPSEAACWAAAPIPARPGRPAGWSEAAHPPRRRRSLADPGARKLFLHAIYHIELSAIDLAVLLCLRASGAPRALHEDFLGIAREEAVHAQLLEGWLAANGAPAGTYPVHHRLWDTAMACADLGEQIVVVPRYLEARGLDVSAELLPRLRQADAAAGDIIERIYRDEIRHVAIGAVWHDWWCAQAAQARPAHFAQVVRQRFPTQLPSPFRLDHAGRRQAGFVAAELLVLESPPPGPLVGSNQPPVSKTGDIPGV